LLLHLPASVIRCPPRLSIPQFRCGSIGPRSCPEGSWEPEAFETSRAHRSEQRQIYDRQQGLISARWSEQRQLVNGNWKPGVQTVLGWSILMWRKWWLPVFNYTGWAHDTATDNPDAIPTSSTYCRRLDLP
jgi:hypothetical protein